MPTYVTRKNDEHLESADVFEKVVKKKFKSPSIQAPGHDMDVSPPWELRKTPEAEA